MKYLTFMVYGAMKMRSGQNFGLFRVPERARDRGQTSVPWKIVTREIERVIRDNDPSWVAKISAANSKNKGCQYHFDGITQDHWNISRFQKYDWDVKAQNFKEVTQ